ncbi:MAG TPA: DUF3524 domain-containing protein [Thermoanaerobaculia bacterium]|nr:DUF3524 domain-containing protein [Thermoanaerobaculia bacterium]
MPAALRVLALEPFHGGSHRQFLEQWAQRSGHGFTILGLPASHWKWRMRQSAPVLARQVAERAERGERWDVLLCSDMLDLAGFRGLAPREAARLPAIAYFHENQLTYPVQREEERDLHFALTNVTTALAADEVWFNSEYHRASLLDAVSAWLERMPDRRLAWAPDAVAPRCRVEWPGVEGPGAPPAERTQGAPLRVLWAARWEHDKDPETLIAALERVDPSLDLEISILGQRFADTPAVFDQAPARLGARLVDLGFVERERYGEILRAADLVVSTARHEFFGLALVEAVLAGARPLLPDRLVYPELLAAAGCSPERARRFSWSGGPNELARRLETVAREIAHPAGSARARAASERNELRAGFQVFTWPRRLPALDGGLERVAATVARSTRD